MGGGGWVLWRCYLFFYPMTPNTATSLNNQGEKNGVKMNTSALIFFKISLQNPRGVFRPAYHILLLYFDCPSRHLVLPLSAAQLNNRGAELCFPKYQYLLPRPSSTASSALQVAASNVAVNFTKEAFFR